MNSAVSYTFHCSRAKSRACSTADESHSYAENAELCASLPFPRPSPNIENENWTPTPTGAIKEGHYAAVLVLNGKWILAPPRRAGAVQQELPPNSGRENPKWLPQEPTSSGAHGAYGTVLEAYRGPTKRATSAGSESREWRRAQRT